MNKTADLAALLLSFCLAACSSSGGGANNEMYGEIKGGAESTVSR